MGCGASYEESGLTIELTNRSTDAFIFLASQCVQCTVQFDSAQYDPDSKLKGAYIELCGQVVYTTSSTHRDTNGNIQTHYTTHGVPFFIQRQNFHSELTWENLMTISQFTKYSKWSFSFALPDELPPSLPPTGSSHSSQPYITYFIRVVLELDKWYSQNIRHSVPLIIYPRINIPNYLYHPIEAENENRKHVRFHVSISQSLILPDIPIIINYNLHNPKRSVVNAIIIQLFQYRQMGGRDSFKTLILEMEAPNVSEFQGEHLHDKFELIVSDMHHPPTSFYTFDSINKLTQFNPTSVTYQLVIEINMSGFFTDFSLQFPIIMGIEGNDRSSSPPSYAFAMRLP